MTRTRLKSMVFLLLLVVASSTLSGCKGLDGLIEIIETTIQVVDQVIKQIDKALHTVGGATQTGQDVIRDVRTIVAGGQLPPPAVATGPGILVVKHPDDEDDEGVPPTPAGGSGGGTPGAVVPISVGGAGHGTPAPVTGTTAPAASGSAGTTPTTGGTTGAGTSRPPGGTASPTQAVTPGWVAAQGKIHQAIANLGTRIAEVEALLASGLPAELVAKLRKEVLEPLRTLRTLLQTMVKVGDPGSADGMQIIDRKIKQAQELFAATAHVAKTIAQGLATGAAAIQRAAWLVRHWTIDLFGAGSPPPFVETTTETPEQKLRRELEATYGITLRDQVDASINTASGNTYSGTKASFSLAQLQAMKKYLAKLPKKWKDALRGQTFCAFASIKKASAPKSVLYGVAFRKEKQVWVAETSNGDIYGWEGTFVHEVTHVLHHVDWSLAEAWAKEFWAGKMSPPPPPTTPAPTDYGETHAVEDLAESVMIYYLDPGKLDKARRDFIAKHILY
jgi:hypothetical protein